MFTELKVEVFEMEKEPKRSSVLIFSFFRIFFGGNQSENQKFVKIHPMLYYSEHSVLENKILVNKGILSSEQHGDIISFQMCFLFYFLLLNIIKSFLS